MKLYKRLFPNEYTTKTNPINSQVTALPFYLKSCGYSSDRKFVCGEQNDYDDYLLLYCVDGSATFKKYDQTQKLIPNTVLFSSCNAPISVTKQSKNWCYFYMIISGTHAKYYYNNIRNKSYIFSASPLSNIMDLFTSIYQNGMSGDLLSNMEASVTIHQLLFELYKCSSSILEAKKITPLQESVVNTAIRYIENNYKDELDIDTICKQVSFSKYYFCKVFKEQTGKTIHQYVNEVRIEKSKYLLSYSKLSIAAVAGSVGFKSPLTFSRCFESKYNMTPSYYREHY